MPAHEASNQSSSNLSVSLIYKVGFPLRSSSLVGQLKKMPLAQRASNCTILQRKALVQYFSQQNIRNKLTSSFALYTRFDDRSPGNEGKSFAARQIYDRSHRRCIERPNPAAQRLRWHRRRRRLCRETGPDKLRETYLRWVFLFFFWRMDGDLRIVLRRRKENHGWMNGLPILSPPIYELVYFWLVSFYILTFIRKFLEAFSRVVKMHVQK